MHELTTSAAAASNGSGSTTDAVKVYSGGATATIDETSIFCDDIDSGCSTPYVSAPSSPGRGQPISGFFYSAPASPVHFVLSTSTINSLSCHCSEAESSPISSSFEFEFSARLASNGWAAAGTMSSADELFLNGQIRPMKLSAHLQRPQALAPMVGIDETNSEDVLIDEAKVARGREMKLRDRSLRRKTRSMSPLRTKTGFQWLEDENDGDRETEQGDDNRKRVDAKEIKQSESSSEANATSESASSSRSSSVGRSSRRWVFLKEFLYRSKSEGRNNGHKFWAFTPVREKKTGIQTVQCHPNSPKGGTAETPTATEETKKVKHQREASKKASAGGKAVNGLGKRRVPQSPHELHYTTNRAQAEEMKKRTFLPYRQGLLGCLGFSSKSYGAINGFARALNPVSSR